MLCKTWFIHRLLCKTFISSNVQTYLPSLEKTFLYVFFICVDNTIQIILNCTFYLQTQRLYCKVVKSSSLRVGKYPDLAEMPRLCEGVWPVVPPEQLPVPGHGDGEAAERGLVPHCPAVHTVLLPPLYIRSVQHLRLAGHRHAAQDSLGHVERGGGGLGVHLHQPPRVVLVTCMQHMVI